MLADPVVKAPVHLSATSSGKEEASTFNVKDIIKAAIEAADPDLRMLNKRIFRNPELGYQEIIAHDTCATLFEKLPGWEVSRSVYGLETAFKAEYGKGGRLVIFNAEYDALPEIGHACGHNLIATSSVAAAIALAKALEQSNVPGRVQILGTPAEEGGGGKVKLLETGAYKGADASLMAHPAPLSFYGDFCGSAGSSSLANYKVHIEFRGRSAHAALSPWDGVNALDAAVLAYNNVSALRQQLLTTDRVHGVIEKGGTVPNVITEYARMNYYLRSPTKESLDKLKDKVMKCFEAAATATGCTVEYKWNTGYLNLVPNLTMCELYESHAKELGYPVKPRNLEAMGGSTDMGDVTHVIPGIHPTFGIETVPGGANHHALFTQAAGKEDSYIRALIPARLMAQVGWDVLNDDTIAGKIKRDFDLRS